MPRSWPSTDAEPSGRRVDLVNKAAAPSVEIEVVDLDPGSVPIAGPHFAPNRRGWLTWTVIGLTVVVGLALLPGQTEAVPSNTTTAQALPEPEMATTSTTLAAASQAVMSGATFSLIPAAGLDGFIGFAGPVEFDGRYWIAGNRPFPFSEVTILSSNDGTRWVVESSVSAGDGNWLNIEDLDTFGGVLMAVGSTGQVNEPTFALAASGDVFLWKSTDGVRWSSIPIVVQEGVQFSGLNLTTSSEVVLITGQRNNAVDPSVLAQVPPELIAGLERHDFTWWYDYSSIRVVAPPGIELFRMSVTEPVPTATVSAILLRSDNLIIWEELPVTFSAWNVAATLDGGFVSNGYDGFTYSPDGRSWERTDRLPPLFYQNWGDRMVGVDYSVTHPNLTVVDGDGIATIDLPPEITTSENVVSITPGAPGLAMIFGSFEEAAANPVTQVDGYLLEMDNGLLRIDEPSGETSYANFGGDGLIEGSYLPETDSIRFENSDGSKTFEFPLSVFLDLRQRITTGLFDVFMSSDGLEWAQGQTGLRSAYADIIGGAGETFLIALRNYGRDYQELPITVYRTGPLG